MNIPSFFRKHAGFGSLLASLSSAAALFLIFRIAYHDLGAAVVGVWALLQGVMLITRLPDMGSANNTTRLVAVAFNRDGSVRIAKILLAGIVVNTLPIVVIGLLIFAPTFFYIRPGAVRAGILPDTLSTFIWQSVAFGALTTLSSLLSGCLDGLGLMALRGYLRCLAILFFIVAAYFMVHFAGDVGLGYSYIIYALLLSVLCAVALLAVHPSVGRGGEDKSIRELVVESFSFNTKFLLFGMLRLLLDPICKILISSFSTLEAVAIFDLANKVTTQVRQLYTAALQAVLPMVSRDSAELSHEMREKLLDWNRLVSRLSFYTMSLAVIASGLLCHFSLGFVVVLFFFL